MQVAGGDSLWEAGSADEQVIAKSLKSGCDGNSSPVSTGGHESVNLPGRGITDGKEAELPNASGSSC